MSNSTFWFSSRLRKPLAEIAEKWAKTSAPPSSGLMKPKPLSALNHFTVPVVTSAPRRLLETALCGPVRRRVDHPHRNDTKNEGAWMGSDNPSGAGKRLRKSKLQLRTTLAH